MTQSVIWSPIPGGITTPSGFQAAGITAGLKASGKPDLSLLLAPKDAVCAGTFTTSVVRAGCVDLCAERLQDASGVVRAVLTNSGQANACTGDRGRVDSVRATQVVGDLLGLSEDQVLICSTGVIGVPIAMDILLPALDSLVTLLSPDGGAAAAQAILTTDPVATPTALEAALGGRGGRRAGLQWRAQWKDEWAGERGRFRTWKSTDKPSTRPRRQLRKICARGKPRSW